MMDNWSSAGARLPRQLIAQPTYPRPMEEILYESITPGTDATEKLPIIGESFRFGDLGMWSQMIPLTEIMSQVKELHERTVQNRMSRLQTYDDVQLIASKLDSWLLRLPKQLQNTPKNIKRFAEKGHGRTLVALHSGFHHHSQLLYYQFLHLNEESSAERTLASTYANRCKEHATELSNLLWLANTTPGCECLWAVTGHLLVISSSIHLHTLLFDADDLQIADANKMLQQNFEMIIELRKYWPSLDLSMSRLRSFHRACQKSMNTSFAMDQWMLHFLQRYMKPVGDRGGVPPLMSSDMAVGWSSPDLGFGSDQDSNFDLQLWYYGAEGQGTASDILQTFF
jgi:alpha-L-rhamnosidase